MYHNPEDVSRVFRAVPCLALAKPSGALRYLATAVEAGTELHATLAQYPCVKYEPLDFHYVCLQSLGALSEELLHDLTLYQHWPGILWAALLVALDPQAKFVPILEAARPRAPHQVWLVDLALGIAAGEESAEFPEHHALLVALAAQLRNLARPAPALRVLPPLPAILEHSERVRAAYKHGGSSAALQVIQRETPDGC